MTPDNQALIEEAHRYVTIHNRTHVVSSDLVGWLADALEVSEASERRAVAAVVMADADNPVIQTLQAQLQQIQDRLEIVHQWAEMNPYSGVHDAPLEVRQALAYKGTGAKILKDRLRRKDNRGGL